MTMLSRLSSSARASCSVPAAVAISFSLVPILKAGRLTFGLHRRLVVHLHLGRVAQRADDLVAAGDDFVALMQPVEHFDVGGARDAGLHFTKLGGVLPHDEHALQLFLPG